MSSEVPASGVPDFVRTAGFGWRVGISIFIVFGWLAFLILWLFFYADEYGVFQNIAILLVSIIIGIGMLAAIWVSWGLRFAGQFKETEWKMDKPTLAWVTNAIAGIGWLVFLIVWLFYYADDYSGYQNLAIFITSLLVLGAVSGSIWMIRWFRPWRKH
jgi:heme/copper-type cytochrome/quinol oxidase subunit 4